MPVTARDKALATLIPATAARFEPIFEKAQKTQPPIRLNALPAGPVGQEQLIALGIAFAREHDWLPALITQCFVDGIGNDALLQEAAAQDIIEEGSTLQSIQNFARGYEAAGIKAEELAIIIRQVCRIDIDGEPKGTGFLVRPDMILTAYHVVRGLIDGGKQQIGSAARLKIVFDDHNVRAGDFSTRLDGRVVRVADQWLAHCSACHDQELAGTLPNDLAQLADRLDYAVIQLATAARIGLPPVKFQEARRIVKDDPIQICQHPGGRGLAIDSKTVTEVLDPDLRFYHDVNAEGGSSGAPCFDSDYRVVGIHQAGPKNGPTLDPKARNRGVPAIHLVAAIQALPPSSPRVTPLAELTETRPGHPVFGRAETQDWVWNEVEKPNRPILALQGLPGSGKSFTYDMLRSLLPPDAHDVVLLSAVEVASRTPEAFAQDLLDRLRYPYTPLPGNEGDTTRPRWMKDTLLQELLRSLDAGRMLDAAGQPSARAKGLWIVIDDIDKASIGTGSDISNFLYAFYAAAEGNPWLRFVLLGFGGDFSPQQRRLVQEHVIAPPTDEDLANYLFAKVPPKFQANLPLFAPVFVANARDEAEAAAARDRLDKLQTKMANVARAFALTSGGGGG